VAMKREWIRVLGLAMVLGVWVAAGCSDDDDDAGEETAVVRVTNTVNGVETVTEVVVTNAPAADVPRRRKPRSGRLLAAGEGPMKTGMAGARSIWISGCRMARR